MNQIIVTRANNSWVVYAVFGQSFLCTMIGGYNVDLIEKRDIKLIARPKKQTCA